MFIARVENGGGDEAGIFFFRRDTDKIGKREARRAAKWLDVGGRMVEYGENEGFAWKYP